MITCNRHIATSLQTMTLRLRETLMSDSTRPTISITGDVSIVTSPVLLLILLCAAYKTVVDSCVARLPFKNFVKFFDHIKCKNT